MIWTKKTAVILGDVNFAIVASTAALATILSIATSIDNADLTAVDAEA